MKHCIIFLLSLFAMGTASAQRMESAQLIPTGPQSRIVVDSISSPTLGETRTYTVLLPRNYDQNPDKRYPVLYLLHGIMDTNEGWYRNGRVKSVMDKLVESGEVCEMIVVTPNAGGNNMRVYGTVTSTCRAGRMKISSSTNFCPILKAAIG